MFDKGKIYTFCEVNEDESYNVIKYISVNKRVSLAAIGDILIGIVAVIAVKRCMIELR